MMTQMSSGQIFDGFGAREIWLKPQLNHRRDKALGMAILNMPCFACGCVRNCCHLLANIRFKWLNPAFVRGDRGELLKSRG